MGVRDSTDAACNSRRDGRTCFAPTREAHDEDEQIDVHDANQIGQQFVLVQVLVLSHLGGAPIDK